MDEDQEGRGRQGAGQSDALQRASMATTVGVLLTPLPVVGVVLTGYVGSFMAGVCMFPPVLLCWILFAAVLRRMRPSAPRGLVWAVFGAIWGQLLAFWALCLFLPGEQACFQDCEGEPAGPSLAEYLLGIRRGSPSIGEVALSDGAASALFGFGLACFLVVPALGLVGAALGCARRRLR